jgi:hypothetical protein
MAHTLQIRNTDDQVKIRSPWAVALLPFITFGIYHFVWWYRINRELRDFGRANGYDLGQHPTNSLLALIPGGFIIVPPFITYWNGTKRVQGASRVAGQNALNGWLALILFLVVAPGYWAYLQVSLNDVWHAEAEALPGQAPLPDHSDGLPPRLVTAPAQTEGVPSGAAAASVGAATASEPGPAASDGSPAESEPTAAPSEAPPADGEPAATPSGPAEPVASAGDASESEPAPSDAPAGEPPSAHGPATGT